MFPAGARLQVLVLAVVLLLLLTQFGIDVLATARR